MVLLQPRGGRACDGPVEKGPETRQRQAGEHRPQQAQGQELGLQQEQERELVPQQGRGLEMQVLYFLGHWVDPKLIT